MHIRLDVNEMTIDDMETLEGTNIDPAKGKWASLKELLALFCYESADEDANKIPVNEAIAKVGKLKIGELEALRETIKASVEDLADEALPPSTEETSSQPSEE